MDEGRYPREDQETPAAKAAADRGIAVEVEKLPEASRGFVLLSRRWVV